MSGAVQMISWVWNGLFWFFFFEERGLSPMFNWDELCTKSCNSITMISFMMLYMSILSSSKCTSILGCMRASISWVYQVIVICDLQMCSDDLFVPFPVTVARAVELKHKASLISALTYETSKLFTAASMFCNPIYYCYTTATTVVNIVHYMTDCILQWTRWFDESFSIIMIVCTIPHG